MKNLPTDALWERVLSALSGEVKKDDFELWLQPVQALALEDRLLKLRVPNKFFSEHIREHFQRRIEEVLRAETGGEV
ncbi:MAG: hypothetical protein KGL53_03895, partial [Elusimicrobia bacterium]|nr:hypothetical protein [Elusimicrobiota bacterium]